jgi:hypothetical protein
MSAACDTDCQGRAHFHHQNAVEVPEVRIRAPVFGLNEAKDGVEQIPTGEFPGTGILRMGRDGDCTSLRSPFVPICNLHIDRYNTYIENTVQAKDGNVIYLCDKHHMINRYASEPSGMAQLLQSLVLHTGVLARRQSRLLPAAPEGAGSFSIQSVLVFSTNARSSNHSLDLYDQPNCAGETN